VHLFIDLQNSKFFVITFFFSQNLTFHTQIPCAIPALSRIFYNIFSFINFHLLNYYSLNNININITKRSILYRFNKIKDYIGKKISRGLHYTLTKKFESKNNIKPVLK